MTDTTLHTRATALRILFGLTATLAGLDKFTGLLADWPSYVAPAAAQFLPVSVTAFMHVVGIVEVAVGVALLGAAPLLGAYLASGWLVLVAANLVLAGYFDVAVRDLVMAAAAFTLARLVQLERHEPQTAHAAPARSVTA